jgi:GAF domain
MTWIFRAVWYRASMERTRRPGAPHLSGDEGPHCGVCGKEDHKPGDVANDPGYLAALDNTRAEIIVPVLDIAGDRVMGTIDVESEQLNAFDSTEQEFLEECARLLAGFWTSGD